MLDAVDDKNPIYTEYLQEIVKIIFIDSHEKCAHICTDQCQAWRLDSQLCVCCNDFNVAV